MIRMDQSKVREALKKNKADEDKKKGGYVDERIWKPEIPKKDKNIYRFRVLPFGNEVPWVLLLQHQIKTAKGFWYENCPATINKPCPICDRAYELYQTEDETDAKEAKKIYKKKVYLSNIHIIKDGRNEGDNEGKVFLYKYGVKVFEKFYAALNPNVEEGEEETFFLDEKEGYDFLLTAKTVGGFANYDESKFAQKATPIGKSDKKIDEICDSGYDIADEITEDKFKTFDALLELFEQKVLGKSESSGSSKSSSSDDDKEFGDDDDDIDDAAVFANTGDDSSSEDAEDTPSDDSDGADDEDDLLDFDD